ncbi:hypothetical protein BDF21DRAFT_450335 [Thamnidium elegans]|nr:hypothetical protein BDF21DRAFT_450335 [Thamnidium elegans]
MKNGQRIMFNLCNPASASSYNSKPKDSKFYLTPLYSQRRSQHNIAILFLSYILVITYIKNLKSHSQVYNSLKTFYRSFERASLNTLTFLIMSTNMISCPMCNPMKISKFILEANLSKVANPVGNHLNKANQKVANNTKSKAFVFVWKVILYESEI